MTLWFYTCVPQMMICLVPEISRTTDRIFCHFRLFFALLPPRKKTPWGFIILNMSTINENHIMYESWNMEHDRQNFFSSWTIFCPFTPPPPKNPANQNFEKMKNNNNKKKTCGYHFTQVYNKWQSYDIWFLDMKCTRQDFFFHLAPFFALLPPYLPEKWKCQKNEKMPGYIIILHKCTIKKWKLKKKFKKNLEISFYKSVPKIMVICHTVPEIWHMTDVIVTFHFGLFFTLLPP